MGGVCLGFTGFVIPVCAEHQLLVLRDIYTQVGRCAQVSSIAGCMFVYNMCVCLYALTRRSRVCVMAILGSGESRTLSIWVYVSLALAIELVCVDHALSNANT